MTKNVAVVLLGILWLFVFGNAVIVLLAGVVGFLAGALGAAELIVFVLLGGGLLAAARALKTRILRHCVFTSTEILKTDSRAPVLLLRAFADEFLKLPVEHGALIRANPDRFELCAVLPNWALGPVIAIGRPGERLPMFGACREYCYDNDWQDRVSELLQQCARIVMILGVTEGLAWEISQINKHNYLHKTLFVMPPTSGRDAKFRFRFFADHLAQMLQRPIQSSINPRAVLLVGFRTDRTPFVITGRNRRRLSYEAAFAAASRIASEASAGAKG
jgi:hypothetical protein